jgi:hypothetical protein
MANWDAAILDAHRAIKSEEAVTANQILVNSKEKIIPIMTAGVPQSSTSNAALPKASDLKINPP